MVVNIDVFMSFLLSLTPAREMKMRTQAVPAGLQQELGVVPVHAAPLNFHPAQIPLVSGAGERRTKPTPEEVSGSFLQPPTHGCGACPCALLEKLRQGKGQELPSKEGRKNKSFMVNPRATESQNH